MNVKTFFYLPLILATVGAILGFFEGTAAALMLSAIYGSVSLDMSFSDAAWWGMGLSVILIYNSIGVRLPVAYTTFLCRDKVELGRTAEPFPIAASPLSTVTGLPTISRDPHLLTQSVRSHRKESETETTISANISN